MKVLTLGTFDLLHRGHRMMLANSAKLGHLTVGVNSDKFVTGYKREPIQDQEFRMMTVRALGYVAVLNDGPGADLIFDQRPDVLAIGPDWLSKDYLGQIGMTSDELFGMNVVLAFIPPPRVKGLSSTELREATET